MDTVNMKKVGDVYEQDMDPYSEYQHQPKQEIQPTCSNMEVAVQPKRIDTARQKMNRVIDGIDEAIEGAELIFEFGNKLAERFRRF